MLHLVRITLRNEDDLRNLCKDNFKEISTFRIFFFQIYFHLIRSVSYILISFPYDMPDVFIPKDSLFIAMLERFVSLSYVSTLEIIGR